MSTRRVDTEIARAAFENALATHDQAFGTFFLARLFGFDVTYPEDFCRVEFDVHDFMFNPQGSLHGGIAALAMDISMGHLLCREKGPGATLEMKVQYLQPARPGRVRAEGRALRKGAGVWFMESRLLDAQGTLLAFATATWKVMRPAP